METFLKNNYSDDIIVLLNEQNDRSHISIRVSLSELRDYNLDWFAAILKDVRTESVKWDAALFAVQRTIAMEQEGFLEQWYQIKTNCHVRFVNLPSPSPQFKIPFPNYAQVGQFREVKGSIVRISQRKLCEGKREFVCSKCKDTILVEADYELMYRFEAQGQCSNPLCKGTLHQKHVDPLPQYCFDYQEIKIQETLSEKNIPPTIIVTLEDDMVDLCQPGDCVIICGTIERRWSSFQYDGLCKAVIQMRAVSLTCEKKHVSMDIKQMTEQMMAMKADWTENINRCGELQIRDHILKSICPQVHGMYPVKLAIALAICSGNCETVEKPRDGLHQRGQSHVLLIGDPGLAKSRLLVSAVSIAPRAIHTTGMGCSSAGLTAAAIKEDGEWQLEAGALVLADGGICCIDEFNLMRESDKTSIHEAMEQQTISMAKAGLVCKLNTRCAVIAAANPKNLYTMSESQGTSSLNIGIASPLLSRFDLVLILRDERDPVWDARISEHLLAQVRTGFAGFKSGGEKELWNIEKLHAHFSMVSNLKTTMSNEAKEVLGAYYKMCRNDPQRDASRTTVRLLDSLSRMAEAHARLLFRTEVKVVDAITVIRLVESSYGFGRFVLPYNVIKEDLPLGPDNEEIQDILNIFDLGRYNDNDAKRPKLNNSRLNGHEQTVLPEKMDLDEIKPTAPLGFKTQQAPEIVGNSLLLSRQSSATIVQFDADDLDQILKFDNDDDTTTIGKEEQSFPSQRTPQIGMTNAHEEHLNGESDDEMMSQALEQLEQQQKTQHESNEHKASSSLQTGNQTSAQHVVLSGRNRIFCTPSDDEHTQSQPRFVRALQNLNEVPAKQKNGDEEDSAYHSINSLNITAATQTLNKSQVSTHPPNSICPSSSKNKENSMEEERHLSFLDSLDM